MNADVSYEPGVDEEEEDSSGIMEVEFAREKAYQLYNMGAYTTHPLRWERVRNDILFEDVVAEFQGVRDSKISCPFHGRDSTPSFYLYKRTNDGYCFGCGGGGGGQGYYDSIRFVAAKMNSTREQALRWLERRYELPPIEDITMEGEEDDPDVLNTLTFEDLAGPYINQAARDIQNTQDVELAEDYIRIYFEAQKAQEGGDPVPLARVLGPAMLKAIRMRK